ncbi:MAG TPA: DUF255 domain-containing protein, partial [Opitutaceae bacterium]
MTSARWRRIAILLTVPTVVAAVALISQRLTAPASSAPAVQDKAEETTTASNAKKTNRLIDEKSPYLLQHAHNPVDWYPWGEEAFAKAKREDKPVFLSVGYSTCYWCHVMEKQSFEDEEVAKIMNEHFVAIKVDREERPDIDEQYMLATQLATGRGGWPNSVWLTPDRKPWMAGTYFPKPQFVRILTQLAGAWKTRRAEIEEQAGIFVAAIAEAGDPKALAPGAGGSLDEGVVARAAATFAEQFDPIYGGFGSAPKFPPHGALELLIQRAQNRSDAAAADLVPITTTLDAMWLGGMHDHIGG